MNDELGQLETLSAVAGPFAVRRRCSHYYLPFLGGSPGETALSTTRSLTMRAISRRPERVSDAELAANKRSAPAKLRWMIRTGGAHEIKIPVVSGLDDGSAGRWHWYCLARCRENALRRQRGAFMKERRDLLTEQGRLHATLTMEEWPACRRRLNGSDYRCSRSPAARPHGAGIGYRST